MAYPNIYPAVVTQMPPRLRSVLDDFGRSGQIDCDGVGYPYLIRVDNVSGNVQAYVVRNGKLASIIMNPRARTKDPILSWDSNDGYTAAKTAPVQIGPQSRRERAMRESAEDYRSLVDQLMEA